MQQEMTINTYGAETFKSNWGYLYLLKTHPSNTVSFTRQNVIHGLPAYPKRFSSFKNRLKFLSRFYAPDFLRISASPLRLFDDIVFHKLMITKLFSCFSSMAICASDITFANFFDQRFFRNSIANHGANVTCLLRLTSMIKFKNDWIGFTAINARMLRKIIKNNAFEQRFLFVP